MSLDYLLTKIGEVNNLPNEIVLEIAAYLRCGFCGEVRRTRETECTQYCYDCRYERSVITMKDFKEKFSLKTDVLDKFLMGDSILVNVPFKNGSRHIINLLESASLPVEGFAETLHIAYKIDEFEWWVFNQAIKNYNHVKALRISRLSDILMKKRK